MDNQLFKLRAEFRLVPPAQILICAHAVIEEDRHVFVLVTTNGDLIILILMKDCSRNYVRQITWFVDDGKGVTALCIDPSGEHLAVATEDGALYILPIPSPYRAIHASDNVTLLCEKKLSTKPTALAWWPLLLTSDGTKNDNAIVIAGCENGELVFISVRDRKEVSFANVSGCIQNLQMCPESQTGSLRLLITTTNGDQWRLLLHRKSDGYIRPFHHNCTSTPHISQSLSTPSDTSSSSGSTVRARLQGLKQLSAEKIASLKQKLADTKKGVVTSRSTGNIEAKGDEESRSSVEPSYIQRCQSCPERLMAYVGETRLSPQLVKNRNVLAGFYAPSTILTIHSAELDVVPLGVHRLPPHFGVDAKIFPTILVTDHLIYAVSADKQRLSVISLFASESALDFKGVSQEHNPESVLQEIFLPHAEKIIFINRQYNSCLGRECILVTNIGVYCMFCGQCPEDRFFELLSSDAKVADKFGLAFGLDIPKLLEVAGDRCLEKGEFNHALDLYKRAKCRSLKSVLKFAASGNVPELLHYVELLLSTNSTPSMPSVSIIQDTPKTTPELGPTDRVHVSNIAVLCFVERLLRARGMGDTEKANHLYSVFIKFLYSTCPYDESLASKILCQTNLWDVVGLLADERGLHTEVLEGVFRTLSQQDCLGDDETDGGELRRIFCNPALCSTLFSDIHTLKCHMQIVKNNIRLFGMTDLQDLSALYNPSHGLLRTTLLDFLIRKTEKAISKMRLKEEFPIADIVDVFVAITVEKLGRVSMKYDPDLVGYVYQPSKFQASNESDTDSTASGSSSENGESLLSVMKPVLSAGFAHCALIRNNGICTWGHTSNGCLGHGPSQSRWSLPRVVPLFQTLGKSIVSVSCGKLHTLALDSAGGVYSWGSNRYGQLGLGKGNGNRRPRPQFVNSLRREQIAWISSGQFHSTAVTSDGRLYTWGWGIHGQLGNGSTENLDTPTLLRHYKNVVQSEGGYGHTLILTARGNVYAFGCGLFGQLGNGGTVKSSKPVRIEFPDNSKIHAIATGYFHNLALSKSKQLYTWGSSPQNLRLLAQAHKRALLAAKAKQQQALSANKCNTENTSPCSPSRPLPPLPPEAVKVNESKEAESTPSEVHLLPRVVDMQHVTGDIIQMACGALHSVILTSKGCVYAWGRNLDCQLGLGSRQGAVHSPHLELNGLSHVRVDQIACGCDFSAALERDCYGGNVFGWGSNANGQLGKPPNEDKGGAQQIEGRILVVKTAKKIVRLNPGLGTQCAVEIPERIDGVPDIEEDIDDPHSDKTRSFLRHLVDDLPFFEELGDDNKALHITLEYFHGYYAADIVLRRCVELDQRQAAAKLCCLAGQYHQALRHQLLALSLEEKKEESLAKEAARIVEFYASLVHDGENMEMKRILQQGFDFWLSQDLPTSHLEEMLTHHLTKFSSPLGLLMSNADSSELLGRLSSQFCLHVCSTLMTNAAVPELKEAMIKMAASLTVNETKPLNTDRKEE